MTECQNLAGSGTVLLAQSSVLLLVILAISLLLSKRGPAATSAMLKAGLFGILILLLVRFVPVHRVQPLLYVPPPSHSTVFSVSPVTSLAPQKEQSPVAARNEAVGSMPAVTAGAFSNDVPVEEKAAAAGVTWPQAIVATWLLGAGLLLLWLLWANLRLRAIRRSARLIADGPEIDLLRTMCRAKGVRMPELRMLQEAGSPFLIGILRPTIVLDGTFAAGDPAAALEIVFAHELAHLEAKDCAWKLAGRIACALLWPQPLLWLLCKRLEQSSEELCDQVVISMGRSRKVYADCLLALAHGKPYGRVEAAAAVGVVPFRSAIGRRISRIMDSSKQAPVRLRRKSLIAIAGSAVGLAACAALAISAAKPQRQANLIKFDDGSDPAAIAVFKQVQEAYIGMDTFSMTSRSVTNGIGSQIFHWDYKRPGLFRIQALGPDVLKVRSIAYAKPGGAYISWQERPDIYVTWTKEASGTQDPRFPVPDSGIEFVERKWGLDRSIVPLLEGLKPVGNMFVGTLTLGQDKTIDGVDTATLILKAPKSRIPKGRELTISLSVGKSDHLFHRYEVDSRVIGAKDGISTREVFEDIKTDPKLDDKTFEFKPALGAKSIAPPIRTRQASPEAQALLNKIQNAYATLKTLDFESKGERGHLFVSLARMNYLRMRLLMTWDGREHEYYDSVADGKNEYVWFGEDKRHYTETPIIRNAVGQFNLGTFNNAGLPGNEMEQSVQSASWAFYEPVRLNFGDLSIGKPDVVGGVATDTIVSSYQLRDQYGMPIKDGYVEGIFSFGKADHLLRRVQLHNHSNFNGTVHDRKQVETIRIIGINRPQPASTYVFNANGRTRAEKIGDMSRIYAGDPMTINVGEAFPAIATNDMDGKPFSLDQYKGKVVLIYAWTTGVGNSDTDLPKIEGLYRKYKSLGFEAVGIACDPVNQDKPFLKSKHVHFRQLPHGPDGTAKFNKELKFNSFPFDYVIGRDGKVFAKESWIPNVEPIIKEALARP